MSTKPHHPGFLKVAEEARKKIRECTAEDVQELFKQKAHFILIDVREDHEWSLGHLHEAQHLSRGILERDIESVVSDQSTKIILYCGGGYRSALAAESLQRMGYQNVYSMKGGWREWLEKAYPIINSQS